MYGRDLERRWLRWTEPPPLGGVPSWTSRFTDGALFAVTGGTAACLRQEHRAILDAIARRDPEAAENLIRAHVEGQERR